MLSRLSSSIQLDEYRRFASHFPFVKETRSTIRFVAALKHSTYCVSKMHNNRLYEGCSNMNASSFIIFVTYMLRQNGIRWIICHL